jgi:asparagine synthase (glutamine-hydrolysing)
MCGIAGSFGSFPARLAADMARMLSHRGPDGVGEWSDPSERVFLAHRRLAIIDLSSRGAQPMMDSTGSAVITFNGEIYNYRELRHDLEHDGFRFFSDCDTEVILNLYIRDGLQCLQGLKGDFAFALWDKRARTLLLARDGLGVKPLYYTRTSRGLVFASELKALTIVSDLDKAINPVAVMDHLGLSYSPSPRTMFKTVHKLEPGHAISLGWSGEKSWQFYELPYRQEIVPMRKEAAVEELRSRLQSAVSGQMVADVKVGAFLSGGLDSGSLAYYARDKTGGVPLDCFTIGFKENSQQMDGGGEDLPFARNVAEHLGVPLHTVWVDSAIVFDFRRMVYHLDEPECDPAALNVWHICKLAAGQGIKVLLSGTGADDIFTGYRRHAALRLERVWKWLPRPVRGEMRRLTQMLPSNSAIGRRLSKAFRFADSEAVDRLIGYYVWLEESWIREILSEDLLDELGIVRLGDSFRRALSTMPHDLDPINQMLYLDSKFFLPDHNLNYVDKMSMAAGVEVRVPYLDLDLVAFAARLPVDFKQRGQVGKWILREAMNGLLPANVINRPKTGFGVPFRHWARWRLSALLREVLCQDSAHKHYLFNVEGIKRLMKLNEAGHVDASYPLFAVACIAEWCRQFADGNLGDFD